MKYNVLLIDGANALHRAVHVGKGLSLPDGTPIGGVFQFLRMLFSRVEEHAAPGCLVVVCWEGTSSARRGLWGGYKAGRTVHGPTSDYGAQEASLKTVLAQLGVCQGWSLTWEADDVIATLAARLGGRGPIATVTGDHDLHQIVVDGVHVIDPNAKPADLADGTAWRVRDVRRRWGVEPLRIPEVKALAGDTSDGIPGATGVGEKTAVQVLRFLDLEGLLAAAQTTAPGDALTLADASGTATQLSPRKCETLRVEADRIRVFLDLCTVRRDVEVKFLPRHRDDAADLFRRFRFASLLAPSTLATVARVVSPGGMAVQS